LTEVGHIVADLRARRQVSLALPQLTFGLLVRCRQLILALAQLENPRRERLHRQLGRLQGLVEPVQPAAHIAQLGFDRLQLTVELARQRVNLLGHQHDQLGNRLVVQDPAHDRLHDPRLDSLGVQIACAAGAGPLL